MNQYDIKSKANVRQDYPWPVMEISILNCTVPAGGEPLYGGGGCNIGLGLFICVLENETREDKEGPRKVLP